MSHQGVKGGGFRLKEIIQGEYKSAVLWLASVLKKVYGYGSQDNKNYLGYIFLEGWSTDQRKELTNKL